MLAPSDEQLLADERKRWPLQERPFADVVAWVSLDAAMKLA